VVTDLEAARSRLLERGVDVGEIRYKTQIGAWNGGFAPGLDLTRGDYASFASFSDPDGNGWALQERGYHKVKRRAHTDARWSWLKRSFLQLSGWRARTSSLT
jgi:hypothetical protein